MKVPSVVTEKEKILTGIQKGLILRDRYTVLFYLRDKGWFDRYAQYATDKMLEKLI